MFSEAFNLVIEIILIHFEKNKKTSYSATVELPTVSVLLYMLLRNVREFQVNNKITDSTILTV